VAEKKPETPEKAAPAAAEAPSAPPAPKGPLILVAVNTLSILALVGLTFYTRVLYKRPAITETSERERLAKRKAVETVTYAPGLVDFKPVTVNIQATPADPKPADGTARQIEGKMHYVYLGFALEIRDINRKEVIEGLRSVIMDQVLALVGRKDFNQLSTVQGRYQLRTQIIDGANQLVRQSEGGESRGGAFDAFVTNVFFTQFLVQ
jgi:flagellar basal body-associated protein FliL